MRHDVEQVNGKIQDAGTQEVMMYSTIADELRELKTQLSELLE